MPPRTWRPHCRWRNGDLLQFADIVLGRFGVDRSELAKAVAEVTEVALLDSKSIELPENAKEFLDETTVRANCVIGIAEEDGVLVVIAADPSPARRRAVEAAAGRPVRWTVADPATIRTFIDRIYRAERRDRATGQELRGRRRPEQGGRRWLPR